MNFKVLTIVICIKLILWFLLFYIVREEQFTYIKEGFETKASVLKYQLDKLNNNYESIDDLQNNIDTQTRKLNMLTTQTNELNKVAYILKYITIISISLLILMICIFVLNFDHIKGPSAVARNKARNIFRKLKSKQLKKIV
jgi:predicted PurR-regulated permease PerM